MSLWCSKREKKFKWFFGDIYIRIMIQNEIFCYMKWNISKKNSYIEGNKNFPGKSCIWETKKKVSLQEPSLGTKGERRLQRNRARL